MAFAAAADDRARLVTISAAGDSDSSVIALEGDRPLSFTTLQLQSPPRVVVDFADTSVAGVPAELSVEDGTVRRVATADVGSGTARVVIELAADAEFDVRARGNRLEVRVPRIAPFVAQAAPPKPEVSPKPPEAAPKPAETAPAERPAEPVRVAQAPAPPPAAAPEPPAAATQPPAAAAPSEAEKRASLPTVSLAGSRPAPPPEPKPLSAAEEKKRRAQEKLAAQQRAVAEAAEAKRRARQQRLASAAAAKKAATDRAAEAKRVAAEKRLALLAGKKARAEEAAAEKTRAREIARAQPPPAPRVHPLEEPRTLTVQEAMALRAANEQGLPTGLGPAAAPKPPEKAPPPKPPQQKPETRRTARADAPAARGDSSRIAINSIGFRPVGNGEVIIRSDRALTYGVGGDERSVLLHLPGSAIPRPNDRRPLDTHFFDGPVLRVVPIDVPGGIDLRIELRAKAEYQLSQAGSVLTVAFSAPK